jgi:hypothetical protein
MDETPTGKHVHHHLFKVPLTTAEQAPNPRVQNWYNSGTERSKLPISNCCQLWRLPARTVINCEALLPHFKPLGAEGRKFITAVCFANSGNNECQGFKRSIP